MQFSERSKILHDLVKEAVKAKRIKSEITTGTQFAGHYLKSK